MTLLHDNDVYVLNMVIRNYERIIMVFWLKHMADCDMYKSQLSSKLHRFLSLMKFMSSHVSQTISCFVNN